MEKVSAEHPRPRLLIADDHVIFAEALRVYLEKSYQVVGVVSNGRAMVESIRLRPDVIVVDVGMPVLNGLDAARRIKAQAATWLLEQEAEEVVMESTAQYWKPVWETLERYWKPIREKREGARRRSGALHLAQAESNRGRRGRKKDFPDAERLVKRLVARELILSFVPDAEQRLWRTVTRKKYQLRRDRARVQNQLESLLEEAHIKLSSLVSDLLGASARRMLSALADGETNPAALAALADQKLRATPEQLCDALGACTDLKPVYRRLLKMALEQLQFLEQQISQLDREIASLLRQHQDAVERLAEVPGLGVDSAQQIIAEVGPTAATFPSEKCLSSWVGACPGDDESAGVNYSHRAPKGNRNMRRQPDGQRGSPDQRKHLRNCVSPVGSASRT
jgi:transposase